jgi:hypothetical protein
VFEVRAPSNLEYAMLRIRELLAGLIAVVLLVSADPAAAEPVHQLRIYEIFDANKAAFHARFRDHAQRIMQRHGFDIAAMWEATTGERTEFVYILRWPDETAMSAAWASFMADKEWSNIKARTRAEHGPLVGEVQSRILRRTDYSPELPGR